MPCIRIPTKPTRTRSDSRPSRIEGHGVTFTIGAGNEMCAEGIRRVRAARRAGAGGHPGGIPAGFWRSLACGDSAASAGSRPEGTGKRRHHLALAAIVNAYGSYAKVARKPLWTLLVE